MTTSSVRALFTAAADVLADLARAYAELYRERTADHDETIAELTEFFRARELRTAAVLSSHAQRHDDDAALEVHVRLGAGFPFSGEELELPSNPTVDELIALAERTDELLGQLGERIQVYAVSGALTETLDALGEHVEARQRELSTVLNELERLKPSPPRRNERSS